MSENAAALKPSEDAREADQSPWRKVVLVAVTHLAIAALTFAVTAAVRTANLGGTGQFIRDFFTSAGFGGLAALTAAAIAYSGIRHQAAVARKTLEQQQNADDSQRWWATFQWTADRALPPKNDDLALPEAVAISTLEELASTATNNAQKIACGGLVDELAARRDLSSSEATGSTEVTSSEAATAEQSRVRLRRAVVDDKLSAALESYAKATAGGAAESAVLRRRAYEEAVRSTLTAVAPAVGLEYQSSGQLGLFGNPDIENRYEVDGAVTSGGKLIGLVEVVAFERAGARIVNQLRMLAENDQLPVIFIAPVERPQFMEDVIGASNWIQWNPGDALETLHRALASLKR